jgi:hypothetical protein
MGNGLTVVRLSNGHISVFDSASQRTTIYSIDADGIILCESGKDHSQYRYAVRHLLSFASRRAA